MHPVIESVVPVLIQVGAMDRCESVPPIENALNVPEAMRASTGPLRAFSIGDTESQRSIAPTWMRIGPKDSMTGCMESSTRQHGRTVVLMMRGAPLVRGPGA